ncbi:MAG TPA: heavy metal translocating P-type ATPase, partial [Burkholderiales bacterium]|nr:heavy metal translocating P-type ATPase [Burkholderiales bacterium]
ADTQPVVDKLTSIGMKPAEENATAADVGEADHPPESSRKAWVMAGVAGVAAIGAEAIAYATADESSWPVIALSLFAIAVGGQETLHKGFTALRTFTLNINLLMSVAVIGALLIGQWPEAAVVIWLFGIAELIEVASLDRARNAIRKLMDLAPETAVVRSPAGAWEEVAATGILKGAVIRARPGERIALDGVVTSGASSVNQAPITGESMPVDKTVGDQLFAGTINERGVLEYEVTAAKGDTTLDRIARSVQEAQGQRAPTQRFVDRFARVYTPVVFVVALLVAFVPPLVFGAEWYDWIYKALVLLVIACPCALVISTPVTVVSGLAAAARRGIVVKGGLYIEEGRKLKYIALDKTGTLTHGRPALTDVLPLNGFDENDARRIAASLEANSDHPVAQAIVGGYPDQAHAEVREFESLTGRGLRGAIDGVMYYIGNHRLVEELKVCGTEVEALLDRLQNEAKTAMVLATKEKVIAVFAVADTVRESSKTAVAELKALGLIPVMLTGDNAKTALAIAKLVDIDESRGDMLPEDKLAAIEHYSTLGPVGMVGDGVNDAPALARAHIGFAMGAAGTDTAIETADVALMQDDLRKLVEFIRLSRRTSRVLWQNIVLALGIKFVFFVLTLTGSATLWMAVFADMGASLIVVFNGLRLMRVQTPETQKAK